MGDLGQVIKILETLWRDLEQEWEDSREHWESLERYAFDNNIFRDIDEIMNRYIVGAGELKEQVDRAISVVEE